VPDARPTTKRAPDASVAGAGGAPAGKRARVEAGTADAAVSGEAPAVAGGGGAGAEAAAGALHHHQDVGGLGGEAMAVDGAASGDDVVSRDQQAAATPPLQAQGSQDGVGGGDDAPARGQPPQLLSLADFGPELEGKRLLVLWPDDGRWDAGEVRAVDMASGRATIIYTEGE
jgi:hypothetical protein